MKEVDAILDGQYKSITEKMGQCDSFFKMISKQMKNVFMVLILDEKANEAGRF